MNYQQSSPPPGYTYHPPIWTHPSQAPPPPRPPLRALIPLTFAHSLAMVIPGIILILAIWWSATNRVCPSWATSSSTCYWLIWLSVPIAVASFIWGVVASISARREKHMMSHVPKRVDVGVRGVLAVGASVCFAMLVYHMVRWTAWSASSEGTMCALLAILMWVYMLYDNLVRCDANCGQDC